MNKSLKERLAMKTIGGIETIINKHREFLRETCHIRSIGIFSLYARNEQIAESDVDIFIEFSLSPGFFEFLDVEEYYEEKPGIKVDLVTINA